MAYVEHELGLLVRLDRAEARKRLLAALREQDGVAIDVAEALGVSASTLGRWVTALGLRDEQAQLYAARGAARLAREGRAGGYPRGRPRGPWSDERRARRGSNRPPAR